MTDSPEDKSEPSINVVNPQTDEDFFAIGRILAERNSTCLKTHTAALVIDRDKRILAWGVNMCCPQGQLYGLPVTECPRMDSQTGTSYNLCMPIHAEVVACLNAFGISTVDRTNLWHFPGFTKRLREYNGFFESKGAVMYLIGHYWACAECIEFAKSVGINKIKFDDLSGGTTLERYQGEGLAQTEKGALDASGTIQRGIVTVEIAKQDVDGFCKRNQLEPASVQPLANLKNLWVITVVEGNEQSEALKFRTDPDVRSAHTIRFN